MPWIRVDDHYDEHPKLAAVGPLGQALWLAGLAYCNRNLTDGFIPWSVAVRLVSWDFLDEVGQTRIYIGTKDRVDEDGLVTPEYVITLLVAGGVWDEAHGGYRIHDYADYQPTKAQVLAERAAKQAAGRAGGLATAIARAQAPAVAESQPVPNPVPVPPETTPPPQVGRRRDGTNPRALGTNPRANGTSPRQERQRQKRDPTPIHEILQRSNDAFGRSKG